MIEHNDLHFASVIEEKHELDAKLRRLDAYLRSGAANVLEAAEVVRLRNQASVMRSYSIILDDRIAHWETRHA